MKSGGREIDVQQLQWVAENRVRRQQPEMIGPLMRGFLSSPKICAPAWRRRIYTLLEECAGIEIAENARTIDLCDGILTLGVVEPARLQLLRLQWEQKMLEFIQTKLPELGINTIRFVVASAS